MIYPSGDNALFISLGNTIDPTLCSSVVNLYKCISMKIPEVDECVPSYTGITVYFNPLTITAAILKKKIKQIVKGCTKSDNRKLTRLVSIPVLYGNTSGPDIEVVASHNKITHQDVIEIHSSVHYLVYMIGFTPGFPYLGGLNSRLSTPRRNEPRASVPGGSVGIAGDQTGIYPLESPGGWQIIGQTPLKLFDPETIPGFLLQAGDQIVFEPVNSNQFNKISELVLQKKYKPVIKPVK